MVVLRIELEHLRLLLVVESARQVVSAELFPPLFALDEPNEENGQMLALDFALFDHG